jgi:DNA helicase-4
MKNPAQYKKTIISNPSDETAVKLLWYEDINQALDQILAQIYNKEPNSEVYLLSRYNIKYYNELDFNQIPYTDHRHQRTILDNDILIKLDTLTVHSSKGKQANYVILYGLQSGRYGFPCEIEDDPVINLVSTEDDKYPNAEERRVFYVALTRAKNQVYLLSNKNRVSSFVHEILSENYEIDVMGEPPKLITCQECGRGVINKIEWDNDIFFSCSHYPACKYKPSKCPACNQGFLYFESDLIKKYQCSNSDCSFKPNKCPDCDGYLIRRRGTPDFYGCSNFHSHNCRYKEELESVDDILDNYE